MIGAIVKALQRHILSETLQVMHGLWFCMFCFFFKFAAVTTALGGACPQPQSFHCGRVPPNLTTHKHIGLSHHKATTVSRDQRTSLSCCKLSISSCRKVAFTTTGRWSWDSLLRRTKSFWHLRPRIGTSLEFTWKSHAYFMQPDRLPSLLLQGQESWRLTLCTL